jgi:hypothetical protein
VKPSLRAVLDSLIDYAGLFPPASLSMEKAVENYARYRREPHAFALGRFVVPAARLEEVPKDFAVSVLGNPEDLPDADVIEVKAANAADVKTIAAKRAARDVFVEIADPSLLDSIREHGLRAKIRTGGTTADAFPTTQSVAAFVRACVEKGVPFKATAGLHHPIRCTKPLTYEPNAPAGTMHGFLNVFLAAALPQYAEKILEERNARVFAFDDGGLWWHDLRVTTTEIRRVRERSFLSFGSCSFEEPVSDLKELGWL